MPHRTHDRACTCKTVMRVASAHFIHDSFLDFCRCARYHQRHVSPSSSQKTFLDDVRFPPSDHLVSTWTVSYRRRNESCIAYRRSCRHSPADFVARFGVPLGHFIFTNGGSRCGRNENRRRCRKSGSSVPFDARPMVPGDILKDLDIDFRSVAVLPIST
jgi:hypothetical protein